MILMSKWEFLKENYVPIKGFENLYSIDKDGNVLGLKRSKIVKQRISKFGYCRIKLCKENKLYYFQVHRLVAQAFIPNPNNLPQVNHKDGNKLNNNVDNLEWCTQSYNMKHAYKMGLEKKSGKKVYQYDLNGDLINVYDTIKKANLSLGLAKKTSSLARRCKDGKPYKGYIWSFDEEICV